MLADIEAALHEGFERDLFIGAQKNLEDKSNPLRLNNYSYVVRELTRHVLHRLAPDTYVLKCSWYKNETEKDNGISRRQRAYYAVQGGLQDSYVKDALGLEVADIHKNLTNAIGKLNKFTHIESDVFGLSQNEVDAFVFEVTEAFHEFFLTISKCRKLIIDALWERIDSAAIDEALRETIQDLDELASHHFIDEVYVDAVKILDITHEFIFFRANGSIGCELQWGSNSDVARGDGAVMSESFPFSCKLMSSVCEPDRVECIENSLGVDTSDWADAKYGLDERM